MLFDRVRCCLDSPCFGSYNSLAETELGIMRKMPWAVYAWPGLPQVLKYGNWSGLVLALVAAAALDGVLLVSFGWTELIGENFRTVLWVVFGVAWVAAIAWSIEQCRRQASVRRAEPKEDSFGRPWTTT